MHIRFNRSLRGDYGRARVGDVKMVTKDIGKSLIHRGLAEEVEGPSDEDQPDKKQKAKDKPAAE